MVILVVAFDYKVERVLVDQGSLANVLFWTTFQKLGKMKEEPKACSITLIGFTGEQVEVQGAINLRTTFKVGLDMKIAPTKFMAGLQTTCRCYEASLKIRSQRMNLERVGMGLRGNVHLLELDPQQTEETECS
ncbi:hypothetical protein CR513_46953, partial [Mucuna pruriens]